MNHFAAFALALSDHDLIALACVLAALIGFGFAIIAALLLDWWDDRKRK